MKKQEDTWDRLIERLTSGETVNWDDELARYPQDKDYIKQLQSLEQIYAVCNSTVADHVKDKELSQYHQFIWGHLQVLELIGEGNFGEVYRAFDPLLNRDVALKLFKSEQMSVVKSRHFMAEARSLAKVRNRHVLAIHGANMHDGRVGFWADLLSGKTLADTPVDFSREEQLLKVIKAVTDALSAVHQAGLVHGDVKLSNVMGDTKDNNDVGKITLMDFGAGGEIDMAASNTGSPILMAPELFKEQAKTAASDTYALGVMLFKLATGEYPIKANNVLDVMQAHKKNQYESLNQLRPDLSKTVRQLINQMLAVDPKQRPDAPAIKNILNEIEIAPQRRKKRLVVVGLFSVLAIATLLFYQANQARKMAESEQQKAEIEKEKATAVSDFLAKILKSSRPNISGKNTPVIEILESAEKDLETSLLDQPLARAQVLHHIGVSYIRMIAPQQALNLLQEAFAIRTQYLGADHINTLDTQSFLATALVRLSRFEDAKPLLLFEDDVINQLPLENDLRLRYVSILPIYYGLTGEVERSEHYAKKALLMIDPEKDPEKYHDRQLQVAIELNNQQRFDESEPIVRESLDPYLIQAYALLSNILGAQSRLEEGLEITDKALKLSKETNGGNDFYSIRLMGNKANQLYDLGQPEAAIKLHLEKIEVSEKALSPKHQFSYLSRMKLAEYYLEQGDFDAGIEMAEMTIPIIEEVRGSKNKWLLELRYTYGALLLGKGDLVAAEKELSETLVLCREVVGDDHPLTFAVIKALEKITPDQ